MALLDVGLWWISASANSQPTMLPADGGQRRTLNGWKEIAAYLGKSVRSVQRSETTLYLPVHRIRTPDSQIIYADADEIDDWRQRLDAGPAEEVDAVSEPDSHPAEPEQVTAVATSQRPARRRWKLAAVAIALFAAGALTGHLATRPDRVPVDFRLFGSTLEAFDRTGTLAWSYQFGREVAGVRRARLQPPIFFDVDGDRQSEILVPVRFASTRPAALSDAIYCFTRGGVLKWRVQPDDAVVWRPVV